jgi:23S rRNA pseudoU1915 N3-methylase RlmH
MKGRLYPGGPTTSKVRNITQSKDGKMRIVHLANGESFRETKAKVLEKFQQVLSADQKAKSLRSMRKTSDGKVAVTIGGAKKGERKTFASVAAAKAAVSRHYGKT